MSLKHWTAGIVVATGLAACTPAETPIETPNLTGETAAGDAEYEAYLAFANDAFTASGASEADLSALVANLPDYASISWDAKSFDADTGATLFEGLSIGFGGNEKFGMAFETAKLWGYDDSLLVSRLQGDRLSESGPVFTRMEGTNASYFGVALAFNSFLDATLAQLDAELPEGFEIGFDRFESNTEQFVVSGVSLRPWELSLLPAETVLNFDSDIPMEVVDLIHVGQQVIAVTRSLEIEKSVSIGTEVALEMRQPGADFSAAFSIDFAAAENLQGFDIEKNIGRGYTGTQTNTYNDAMAPGEVITLSGFPAGFSLKQEESYAATEILNMQLDKAMGYLARSELPGMDERDLLSLGTWAVTDYTARLNDNTILTADRAFFNGDQFDWVIPSDLSLGMEGAKLSTGELTDFFFVFFEAFMSNLDVDDLADEEQAQMELVREGVEKAIELLPEHGLEEVPFDFSVSASWNSDSGPTDFSMRWDSEGFGRNELDLGITLPTYEALQAAFNTEESDDAFETAMLEAFSFRGARWFEEDKGGYDKLLGFAHAIGKEYPDQGWGAMLGSMEPPQMRTYLGTMVRMGKAGVQAEFPPAEAWIESFATYLETGGSIEFASNPPSPIDEALIDSYEEDPEPEEIVEIFGLTVTHTK